MNQTKYVIPMGAAVPDELSELTLVTGTLSARLAAFELAEKAVLPLTDVEINALSRAVEVLPLSSATVLVGLPGSFSSAVFDAAVATAGLPTALWDEVKAKTRADAISAQRTRETRAFAATAPVQIGGDAPAVEDEGESA